MRFPALLCSRLLLVLILLPALLVQQPASPLEARPRPQTVGRELTLGRSGEGRPITAVRFGDGPRKLVVVGDTHGGPEANTYVLTNQLIDYFRANPEAVPPGVRLYLIPTLNPDGLAAGSRFNANFVDLNRNMNTDLDSCPENDWRNRVEGAYGVVSDTGGPYPDSEVESRLIRAFLLDASGAIFIHSNAGLVFPAFCEHAPSIEMAKVYAAGANYVYSRFWDKYFITGGMHDWAGSMGIAAITPELVTGDQSEFPQNLAGLQAVLAQADSLLPPPQDHEEAGIVVPAVIWRYWKSLGGAALFGPPLAPATSAGGVTRQAFERAVLTLNPEQADTPYLVQPEPLGRAAAAGRAAPARPQDGAQFFPESGHTLGGAFERYWQRNGGLPVFGFPLTEEMRGVTFDGGTRRLQVFERAVLAEGDDGAIQPEPLGREYMLRAALNAPASPWQIR